MIDHTLFERSFEEIKHIARWYADHRGRSERSPTLLLIGGWAVYKHNPYTYSKDIDLVINSNTRQGLIHWLRKERGFVKQRNELGRQSVMLRCPHGNITLDHVSTTSKNQFHGRKEALPFDMARKHFVVVEFEEGFLPIPERGPLLLLKMKALYDRTYDIQIPGADIEWLKQKIAKDKSDILSLIDMDHGGDAIDLELVGKELERIPFLTELLGTISSDPAAISLYRVTSKDAGRIIGTFLSLVR